MEEELNQEENTQFEELTPEEAKASLGLATRLSEDMLRSQAPQQEMPEEPMNLRDQYDPEDLGEEDDKMDMILEEISSIKDEIEMALNEDEEDGEQE